MKLKIKSLDNKYLLVRLLIEGREIELGMYNKVEAEALLEEMKSSFIDFRDKINKLK